MTGAMIDSIHFASVFFMTGIIWLIQVIHYPSFKYVDLAQWKNFHQFHTSWITPIVAPVMLIQLASSFFISQGVLIPAGLSSAVFAVTFFISVPLHNKLSNAYDLKITNQLIKTNWLRTVLWSLHSVWIIAFSF